MSRPADGSPVPTERFVASVAGLSPRERAAFLADCWAARGRTVDRDGTRVTVDGAVVAFETGGLDATVDRVVVPEPSDRLRERARALDVTITDGADVRDLLLYGLDREVAESLYRSHVGRPLVTSDAGDADQGDEGAAGAAVPAVALAVLLVAVTPLALVAVDSAVETRVVDGPAAFVTDGAEPSGANATGLPPGVTTDSVDVQELAAAHADVLRGATFTVARRYDGPENGSSYRSASVREVRVRVASSAEFRVDRRVVDASGAETVAGLYADGRTEYNRVRRGDDVDYGSTSVGGASNVPLYVGNSQWVIEKFLRASDVRVFRLPGGETVRVEATGTPEQLPDHVADYRATATVGPDGLVESLRVRYTDTEAGTTVLVVQTVEDVGTTTVDPPDWYATHPDRNRSDAPAKLAG